jgi:hypothetical protein
MKAFNEHIHIEQEQIIISKIPICDLVGSEKPLGKRQRLQ